RVPARPRALPSFPTRRSSDLARARPAQPRSGGARRRREDDPHHGGAGSIGSELARQVARFRPRRIVLLDRAENTLYFVWVELRRDRKSTRLNSSHVAISYAVF